MNYIKIKKYVKNDIKTLEDKHVILYIYIYNEHIIGKQCVKLYLNKEKKYDYEKAYNNIKECYKKHIKYDNFHYELSNSLYNDPINDW